jgi:hypothetical protein
MVSLESSFHDFAALYEKLLLRKYVLGLGSANS